MKAFWTATLALAAAMPAAAADKGMSDLALIQRMDDQFGARANAGDAAGVAALYAPDAVLLPPNAPRLDGRAKIQGYWTQGVAGVTDVRLTPVSVRRLAPDAIEEIGTYAMRTRATPSQPLQGKYVVIWRRGPAGWQLQTDIWN